MARTYYLALVDKTATTFSSSYARHDENMRSFSVDQVEGDFCSLSVVIKNPSVSLLDPSRGHWAWLSMQEGATITPLFFGRIVGVPAEIQNEFVTVDFIAKPSDYEAAKLAVADTLRVAPYWDYAFVDPQMWEDADAVLEARTDVWHIDRVSHDVTISSIIAGEDGSLNITSDLIADDTFGFSYRDAPLRKVVLEMRAMWTQEKSGVINITRRLLKAFEAQGSEPGFVTSYTGSGLYNNWPMENDALGNVYTFGPQTIEVADGFAAKKKFKTTFCKYERANSSSATADNDKLAAKVKLRRWAFTISSAINYAFQLQRIEDIRFRVYADVQGVVNDEDDEQSEIITMSSGNIGTKVGPNNEIPIRNVAREAYFSTARGRTSIRYGLCHARALLMRRARAVEVKCAVPFATAILATCRKSATIYHPDLPGGVAEGKIVAYHFGVDGDSGAESGEITIACMVGRASGFPDVTGTPTYASADYVGSDYQEFEGATVNTGALGISFTPPVAGKITRAVVGLQSVTVINGETEQLQVLSQPYIDVSAMCNALNEKCTKVDLRMIPLDTSPRQKRYTRTDANLSIPKGVDLGEVA